MIRLLCKVAILCALFMNVSSNPSKRQMDLEFGLFYMDSEYSEPMSPEKTSRFIQELHKLYYNHDRPSIHREYIEKLAELAHLTACDDNMFMKFDLVSKGKQLPRSIRGYIINQSKSMAEKCDAELLPKFEKIVDDLDPSIKNSVEDLGGYMGYDRSMNYIKYRPLFTLEELIEGAHEVLVEKSEIIAKKESISREEFNSLYKRFISAPCAGLTLDFDQMSRFYIRNFLEKGTLVYCDDFSKKWIFNAEVCSTILNEGDKVSDLLYKLVMKYNEKPEAYKYQILDEMRIN